MKITKNIVSRDEVFKNHPEYVNFVENGSLQNWQLIFEAFENLQKGQTVITYIDKVYVRAKVTTINHNSRQAVDGPVVRVSNGEYSWRVDGNKYAVKE